MKRSADTLRAKLPCSFFQLHISAFCIAVHPSIEQNGCFAAQDYKLSSSSIIPIEVRICGLSHTWGILSLPLGERLPEDYLVEWP